VGGPVIDAPEAEMVAREPPFVARIRLRARRRVLWLRYLWTAGQALGEAAEPTVVHAEIDRILAEPEWMSDAEATFYASERGALELADALREADEATAADPRWERLRMRLNLTAADADLFSLAVAAELQPELTRLYGYLQDEPAGCQPSAALAARLFEWPPGAAVAAGAGLLEWALARPVDPGPAPATTGGWIADPEAVAWLTGDDDRPQPAGTTLLGEQDLPSACLYPNELAEMVALVEAAWRDGRPPVELELVGLRGSGRAVLAGQLARVLGRRVLVAEARSLDAEAPAPEATEAAIRIARAARLADAVLYWRDADQAPAKALGAVRGKIDLAVLGATERLPRDPDATTVAATYRLPALDRATRSAVWRELAGTPPRPAIADLRLTPGEIARAARLAAAAPAAALDACRRQVEVQPGELLSPLPCPYDWDDIVLPAHLGAHLREFEQQARWRWEVYEDWGFERLVPLGRGLTALFAGPSGTGKTMATQVIARALGLDLYRIDLAGVVNKYIGETEKRLKRVFDGCERAGAILLFDEADALFGRRAQVKDAHDRYANIEIDYLLQRMEQFDGIAVLATNRKEDLDRAFMRRLRFVVDFLRPGPVERLEIWRRALPERSPRGERLLDDVDFELLAARLPLTGAGIKASALGAAFLARAEDRPIRMDDVLAAAKRELAKHGAEVRPGDWQE
jgi:ATPase family associated with various cellular activities (AAA)